MGDLAAVDSRDKIVHDTDSIMLQGHGITGETLAMLNVAQCTRLLRRKPGSDDRASGVLVLRVKSLSDADFHKARKQTRGRFSTNKTKGGGWGTRHRTMTNLRTKKWFVCERDFALLMHANSIYNQRMYNAFRTANTLISNILPARPCLFFETFSW